MTSPQTPSTLAARHWETVLILSPISVLASKPSRRYKCPCCGHKGRTSPKNREAVMSCAHCRSEFNRVTGEVLVQRDYVGDTEDYLFEEGY